MRARDALSHATVRVVPEARLSDVIGAIEARRATHALVFDDDCFHGVVPLQSVLYSAPQRIFADLVVRPPLPSVRADLPLEAIGERLRSAGADAVNVIDEGDRHLGLVTQNSLLKALSDQARQRLVEIQNLQSRQEHLRIMGQIACGISHDLNNLLSPILGTLELLAAETSLPAGRRNLVRHALTAAGDTIAAVRRLQDFYRRDSGESRKTAVQLADLLQDARLITRPRWCDEAIRQGKQIEVGIEAGEVDPVRANPGEMRELLINLLLNAVDAVQNSGRVDLRLYADADSAVLVVSDDGTGMTAEQRASCFEPFYTTKGDAGTGLGLSICREIVEGHGGNISVESSPGRGSRFRIRLPLDSANNVASRPAELRAPDSWLVLYVDDDPRLRELFSAMLGRLDQDVETVAGGGEAIERVGRRYFDLVMSDLTMPGMDGLELLSRIREMRPGLPLVLLTGWGAGSPLFDSRASRIPDLVLHKPLSVEDLHLALLKLQRNACKG